MKKRYKLILVAGARPNFMKIAPLMRAFHGHPVIDAAIVHTGQHYDEKMSELFFRELDIPEPEVNLEVGSASHAVQTARIMERFEGVCLDLKPDMVMVVGDVNSTAACTLVASKLDIETAHYEAGLRSRDRSMPEEINRVVTDAVCDYFFTTSEDASENLIHEGKPAERIFLVGNLMIDTLLRVRGGLKDVDVQLEDLGAAERTVNFSEAYSPGGFGVATFHRPSNVDTRADLERLVHILCSVSRDMPIIFPAHPRTYGNIKKYGLMENVDKAPGLLLTHPVGYLGFITLVNSSKFVMTDSGGIQEETTVLGIPCLTVRDNTERPVTIWEGTNKLIKIDELPYEVGEILKGNGKRGRVPRLWDGKTAGRIVKVIEKIMS
ncbi:MAG: UDP-N-acetylglucosamine 2-epimerase (non-hydrolyzing) [Deltaproteobacteria bacterium]|nr:UDP-N-acetylglucosamine 2-epimerase (non-hydrolyzing) [Deltaproteobacteria bacterium]